jgi:DNA gyrase subunit B
MAEIEVLSLIEHVRRRPAMYIGDLDALGLHHMVFWLLRDAFDSTPAPGNLTVTVEGSWLSIEDDREPATINPERLAEGSGALDQVAVANALAREFILELWRDGVGLRSEYRRGVLQAGPQPFSPTTAHGFRVLFAADEEIFTCTTWDYGLLTRRLHEFAGLHDGAHVVLHRREDGRRHEYLFPRGPASWVEQLAPTRIPSSALRAIGARDELRCDVGWTWVPASGPRVMCYANTVHTRQGGSHDAGFREAIGDLGRARGLHPLALVSVTLPHPRFQSPIRGYLANEEIRPFVRDTVSVALEQALCDPELRDALGC